MVLITPYLDIAGAGYIVTMAHTIHVKQQESTTADDVVAVMGADFPLTYFSKYVWAANSNIILMCFFNTPTPISPRFKICFTRMPVSVSFLTDNVSLFLLGYTA